jgi:hypothetical protein
MRWGRWPLFAAVTVAVALVALPAAGDAGTRNCPPAAARSIVANPKIAVYAERGRRGGQSVYACARAGGADRPLVESDYGDRAFGDETFALAGTTVGSANDLLFENSEVKEYRTLVAADRYHHGWQTVAQAHAGAGSRSWVGSVAVWRDGSLAWISCPRASLTHCRSTGGMASVYVRPHPGVRRRVAHGRAIDPLSVRHQRDRVSWVQRGQRRSVPLRTGP